MNALLTRLAQVRRFARRVYAPHKLALRQEVPKTLRALGVQAPVIQPRTPLPQSVSAARGTLPRPAAEAAVVTPQRNPAQPALRPSFAPAEEPLELAELAALEAVPQTVVEAASQLTQANAAGADLIDEAPSVASAAEAELPLEESPFEAAPLEPDIAQDQAAIPPDRSAPQLESLGSQAPVIASAERPSLPQRAANQPVVQPSEARPSLVATPEAELAQPLSTSLAQQKSTTGQPNDEPVTPTDQRETQTQLQPLDPSPVAQSAQLEAVQVQVEAPLEHPHPNAAEVAADTGTQTVIAAAEQPEATSPIAAQESDLVALEAAPLASAVPAESNPSNLEAVGSPSLEALPLTRSDSAEVAPVMDPPPLEADRAEAQRHAERPLEALVQESAAERAQPSLLAPELPGSEIPALRASPTALPSLTADAPAVESPPTARAAPISERPAIQPSSPEPSAVRESQPGASERSARVIEEYRARAPRNLPPRPAKPEPPPEPTEEKVPSRPPEAWMNALREIYASDQPQPEEADATTAPVSLEPAPQQPPVARPENQPAPNTAMPAQSLEPERSASTAFVNQPAALSSQADLTESQPAPIPEDVSKRTLGDWQRALARVFQPQPTVGPESDPAPLDARVPPSSGQERGAAPLDVRPAASQAQPQIGPAARSAPQPGRRFVEPRLQAAPISATPMAQTVRRDLPAAPIQAQPLTRAESATAQDAESSVSQDAASPFAGLERIELSGATRRFLEPLVGFDPAEVPVLTGAGAERIAEDLHADAAAIEGQILMPDTANLESPEQLGLLAHELTHIPAQRRFVAPKTLEGETPIAQNAPVWATEEDRARLAESRVTRLARQAPLTADVAPNAALPAEAGRFEGLPAPWEPMPNLEFGEPARQAPRGEGREQNNVISLVGAGLSADAWGDAASPAPSPSRAAPVSSQSAAGSAQLAEEGRPSGEAESQSPAGGQDLDHLARQVYDVLKRKLAFEKSRGGF